MLGRSCAELVSSSPPTVREEVSPRLKSSAERALYGGRSEAEGCNSGVGGALLAEALLRKLGLGKVELYTFSTEAAAAAAAS